MILGIVYIMWLIIIRSEPTEVHKRDSLKLKLLFLFQMYINPLSIFEKLMQGIFFP